MVTSSPTGFRPPHGQGLRELPEAWRRLVVPGTVRGATGDMRGLDPRMIRKHMYLELGDEEGIGIHFGRR